jgi:hypothetical protein|tara:strand:+ start:828 stop:977 length:150 start_codon:yes stop_codon:yes gene_type:complete
MIWDIMNMAPMGKEKMSKYQNWIRWQRAASNSSIFLLEILCAFLLKECF